MKIILKMKNKLNWEIFSNQERNSVIDDLKRIISSNDGFIVNFNFFSDLSLSLTVEIEERKIENLHNALRSEVTISELGHRKLNKESMKEWWLFVNVNFNKGKGELKINIPEVPG
jgi:hypothetical protein